ncbi:hypothetical protein ACV3SO_13805 [Clostridium perfringens]|nr:hypothetical protein [Clostridium perfringens]MDM0964126.1 hypothetical protein [Clostridium perfringens]
MQYNTEKFLKSVSLKERYDFIERFIVSVTNVTNEGMPQVAERNPILSNIVLRELNIIDKVIEADKKNIKLEDINIEDIAITRNSELSESINLFLITKDQYKYQELKEAFEKYKKMKELEKISSLEERKNKLKSLENEIDNLNNIMLASSEVEKDISYFYFDTLKTKKKEYEALKKLVFFKSIEEINEEIYNKMIYILEVLHERIKNKIKFLEKHC